MYLSLPFERVQKFGTEMQQQKSLPMQGEKNCTARKIGSWIPVCVHDRHSKIKDTGTAKFGKYIVTITIYYPPKPRAGSLKTNSFDDDTRFHFGVFFKFHITHILPTCSFQSIGSRNSPVIFGPGVCGWILRFLGSNWNPSHICAVHAARYCSKGIRKTELHGPNLGL